MKSKFSVLLFASGLIGSALIAQEPNVVVQTPAPAPAPEASPAAAAPAPDRTVHAPRLPTPAELTNIAAAQGQTVERIDETRGQVSVTTKSADGRMSTVMYRLLASTGNTPVASTASYTTTSRPAGSSETVVVQSQPATTTTRTVVVREDPEVVYVNRPYYSTYYDPWAFWGPVAVGVGFGYAWGYGHGGYYGGYHGGYHGHGGSYGHGGYHGGGGHHH